MATKHTPGPWQLINEGSSVATADNECNIVAVIFGDDKQCKLDDRLKSNALLIAAAPDLLEALKLALSSLETAWHEIDGEWGPIMSEFGDLEGAVSRGHCSTDAIRAARSAIAKATGEKI
jgi:hypothetical protein